MRSLFVHHEPPPLTSDSLYDLLSVKLSPEGDNRRELEEEVLMYWTELLQCMEGMYCDQPST